MKITRARIEHGSRDAKDIADFHWGRTKVVATMEDGREELAFSYYPDELSFTPEQFVGKTLEEARQIHHRADVAYLRS